MGQARREVRKCSTKSLIPAPVPLPQGSSLCSSEGTRLGLRKAAVLALVGAEAAWRAPVDAALQGLALPPPSGCLTSSPCFSSLQLAAQPISEEINTGTPKLLGPGQGRAGSCCFGNQQLLFPIPRSHPLQLSQLTLGLVSGLLICPSKSIFSSAHFSPFLIPPSPHVPFALSQEPDAGDAV